MSAGRAAKKDGSTPSIICPPSLPEGGFSGAEGAGSDVAASTSDSGSVVPSKHNE